LHISTAFGKIDVGNKKYMKKLLQFVFIIVGIIIVLIVSVGLYNFFFLGQKDFGFLYKYYYCQNGIYYSYPRGIVDGGTTYYNEIGEKITSCPGWGVLEGECKETHDLAGVCTKKTFY